MMSFIVVCFSLAGIMFWLGFPVTAVAFVLVSIGLNWKVNRRVRQSMCLVVISLAAAQAFPAEPKRPFRYRDVFDLRQPIIFQDDFSSGQFRRWNFSEDDRYRLEHETPERIAIVSAPGLAAGKRAVRFYVPRGPNSFRAEISLPHEPGFHERWYGARILVPKEWVFDPLRGNDLVMQWHAIPGNGKPTNPNLEISVANTNWHIRQTYGGPPDNKKGWQGNLADPVRPGEWVAWVIHARWSPGEDGMIEIWRDGKLVVERKGINVYSTLGVEYTPYLKTGIYHPSWHLDKPGSQEAFDKEHPVATNKVIYVTDIKIGDERARYADVAPSVEARATAPGNGTSPPNPAGITRF